jgi:hypothetical protein
MLWVPCNTRSQRDSQHGEVTPRRVGLIGYLAIKAEYSQFTSLLVTLVSLILAQNTFAHPRVKHLDDGVLDSISLLMGSSRDHTPKTFHVPSCTSTCFGAPF